MNELWQKHQTEWKKLIKRFDSSFFYYDLDYLQEHLSHFTRDLDPSIKLWYACKANPLSAIIKIFRNLHFGIDVASIGELEQVLSAGVRPEDILSTGPSKSRKYLRELLHHDVDVIVCESLNQARWLNEMALLEGKRPQVLLRVQLEFDGGHSVLGGNSITPFGTTIEQWKTLDLKELKNLDIKGAHAFQWGNILDLNQLKEIWWKTTQELTQMSKEMGFPLEILDLGGGLGVPYEKGQKALEIADVNALLMKLKKEFSLNKIWMELGRFAVAECGFYMTQIIDRKQVRGRELLVLDGGINHIARPALTDQAFPAHALRPFEREHLGDFVSETQEFHVHGPLCTALDFLGSFELPKNLDEGDWLVFSKTGAYGFTEAMPFFLCHKLPAEVVSFKGDIITPRPPKLSNDWLV